MAEKPKIEWSAKSHDIDNDGRPWQSVCRLTASYISKTPCNRISLWFYSSFADVRKTLQGKMEERLPFFSFIFPDEFKKRYATEYATFKENLHRLTTPFDVHETFLDLLSMNFQAAIKYKHRFQRIFLFILNRYPNQGWPNRSAITSANQKTDFTEIVSIFRVLKAISLIICFSFSVLQTEITKWFPFVRKRIVPFRC